MANEGPSRTRFAADPVIGLVVGVAGRPARLGHRGRGRHPALRHPGAALPHRHQGRDPDCGDLDGVHVAGRRGMCRAGGDLVRRQPGLGRRACSRTGWPRHRLSRSAVRWAASSRGSSRAGRSSASWPSSAWSQYALTCYHEHIVGWSLVLAALGVIAVNLALHRSSSSAGDRCRFQRSDWASRDPSEVRLMSMRRTVILGSLGWVTAISLLHGGMNLGLFDRARRAKVQGRGHRSASASSP